jgi:hypothetical protein
MTICSKRALELFAVFIFVASCPSFAHAQSADANATPEGLTPNVASTVTTTGGTANKVAKFSGATTIVNSLIFDNGTDVGINTTSPTATLTVAGTMTVNGNSTFNGQFVLPATGTATATSKFGSQFIKFNTSAFNSSTSSTVPPRFQLQAEVTGNDTASPNATLNLLASATSTAPTETGFFINTNGTIHFAPGQTFPGGGPFCIATAGGFGSGGTTFVGPGFTGKTLTVSVSSADPDFVGAGSQVSDYIQLTRTGTTGSFTGGTDQGEFAGSADQVTCTSGVLSLPDSHD